MVGQLGLVGIWRWYFGALATALMTAASACGSAERNHDSSAGGAVNAGNATGAASGNAGVNGGGLDTGGTKGADAHTGGAGGTGGGSGSAGTNAGDSAAAGDAGAGGDAAFAPEFSMGYCVPKGPLLADVPGVQVIAEGDFFNSVQSFALQGTTVYYKLDDGGIFRRARGGQPELVVDIDFVWDMFVRGDYLYWIDNDQRTLMRASLATLPATPEPIVMDVREDWLTYDATDLYFSHADGAAGVYKLPFAQAVPGGGAVPTQVLPMNVGPLKVADGRLYYVNSQAVWSVPTSGGEPKALLSLGGLNEVLVVGDTLFAAATANIVERPLVSDSQMTTPLARGNLLLPTSSNRVKPERLLLDADRLYYREEYGPVAWVKTDGSDCRMLADFDGTGVENMKTELDADYVYVIEKKSRLLAIPR